MNQDIEYLDKHFPKGNKLRGEAMVLLALARIEGRNDATHKENAPNHSQHSSIISKEHTDRTSNLKGQIDMECKSPADTIHKEIKEEIKNEIL